MPTRPESPSQQAPAPGGVLAPDGTGQAHPRPSRGIPWEAVVGGLVGAVPPAWAVVFTLAFIENATPYDKTLRHAESGVALVVLGVILLGVALVIPTRTRGVAQVPRRPVRVLIPYRTPTDGGLIPDRAANPGVFRHTQARKPRASIDVASDVEEAQSPTRSGEEGKRLGLCPV